MHVRTLAIAVFFLLLAGSVGSAQTPEIQKQVAKKLGELKIEKTALDDLLTLALKHHPDIAVAESKLRDANEALYRTRMQILEKVTMLYYDIKAAMAAANEAKARCDRDQAAYNNKALSAAELSASLAARDKFRADVERIEAQMEFLTGKHTEKTAKWLDGRKLSSSTSQGSSGIQIYYLTDGKQVYNFTDGKVVRSDAINFTDGKVVKSDAVAAPSPIAGPLTERIRKALDQPFTVEPKERMLATSELPALLRKNTKGVNVLKEFNGKDDVPVTLPFHEPIPVGALYQWIEDRFHWRFVIRDYGIVAVDRETVPPGAVLLLDFWRQGPSPTAAP